MCNPKQESDHGATGNQVPGESNAQATPMPFTTGCGCGQMMANFAGHSAPGKKEQIEDATQAAGDCDCQALMAQMMEQFWGQSGTPPAAPDPKQGEKA